MPTPLSQAWPADSSDSLVLAHNLSANADFRAPDPMLPRVQSKLPTFVRGRVLAGRFFVDEVCEVSPHSTFLRAHDLELERVVLVRLLPRPDFAPIRGGANGWFKRIDHPPSGFGILDTLGTGVLHGGWPLLVSHYWRGRSLEASLRSGVAPHLLVILQFARQVALALVEAHRWGRAHGDLGLDDVWLCRQADGSERAMLLGVQPHGGGDADPALLERDLHALGDLLNLMLASLAPRYPRGSKQATLDEYAPDSGPLMVLVSPLARVAARCRRPDGGRPYRTAVEVVGALEQIESIASQLSPE